MMYVSLRHHESDNQKGSPGPPLPLACPLCTTAATKNSWRKQWPLFSTSAEQRASPDRRLWSDRVYPLATCCGESPASLWTLINCPYDHPWISSKMNLVTNRPPSHLADSQQLPSLPQCLSLLLYGLLCRQQPCWGLTRPPEANGMPW